MKSGVDFGNEFAPAGARILEELKALVTNYDFDVWIISARDGVHSETQLTGEAFDLGTHTLTDVQKRRLVADLRISLGLRFCTILEAMGTLGEYIHVRRKQFMNYSVFDYLLNI